MNKTFAVLGAGMQGTAAAYDLVKFASPKKVLMGDVDLTQAETSAKRIAELTGSATCEPAQVNALEQKCLAGFLEEADVVLSCIPYWMHPRIAKVAIETKTNMVDLGGNTEITMKTLKMNDEAVKAGVTLVPDTGLAPGLVNNIGCYFLENMDSVETVRLYCGVLPQNPKPPFNYKLTFNVEGLVAEYEDEAVTLTDGEIKLVPTLTELEEINIKQLGKMEAFTTSGGSSTAPYSLQGKVKNYCYKTIRFPGHCERMKIFKDFGFWSLEPVEIDGCKMRPRMLWHKLMGEGLATFVDKDLAVVRGIGIGTKDGKNVQWQIDIFDLEDEKTGFTAMERLTGFSCSIYAIDIAEGLTDPGCLRYETAIKSTRFIEQLERRGVEITITKQ